MRWRSFLRFFAQAWKHKQSPIFKPRRGVRYRHLLIETLETRNLLAGALPTIVASGVVPLDGSVLTGPTAATPVIQVQFSQPMTNSAINPNNYVLLGATGGLVPITGATFVDAPTDSTIQLTYNTGNPGNVLVVDTYTLYVRGNNLLDTNGDPVAQPGQLFAANSGSNDLAVVNVPGNGSLGTLSNYFQTDSSGNALSPRAMATGDLDGDGLPDLVVADFGQLTIYAGRPASAGGGFSLTPSFTAALPTAGPGPGDGESIVLGDFNNDGKIDIATANEISNTVTVFLNNSSAGSISFAAPASYAVDGSPSSVAPSAITAGDFDGDGNLDLAIAVSGAPTTIAPFAAPTYRIDILPGGSNGTFGAVVQVAVGDTAPLGIVTPQVIASGDFNGDGLPDLAVGASNGLFVLTNASTGVGNFTFAVGPALEGAAVDSVTVGHFDAGTSLDIAAAVTPNSVDVFRNDGSGNFLPPYAVTDATGGQIIAGDLNNDGIDDLVTNDGQAAGHMSVLTNNTIGGTIDSATNTSPIIVSSANNHLQNGEQVSINGATGDLALNNVFTITLLNGGISAINARRGRPSSSPPRRRRRW